MRKLEVELNPIKLLCAVLPIFGANYRASRLVSCGQGSFSRQIGLFGVKSVYSNIATAVMPLLGRDHLLSLILALRRGRASYVDSV